MRIRDKRRAWQARGFLVAAVVLSGLFLAVEGCSESSGPASDAARGPAADAAPSQPSVQVAPRPSDLRIELVKPGLIYDHWTPVCAGDTAAQFGWLDSTAEHSPEALFYYAAEKAVPFSDPNERAKDAVPYIAGTIPGYITPYDRFRVIGCSSDEATVTFTVKYVRGPDTNRTVPTYMSDVHAYYAVDLSALPPETRILEIRFEKWWGGLYQLFSGYLDYPMPEEGVSKYLEDTQSFYIEDVRVEIDTIRCENYFNPVEPIERPQGHGELFFESWELRPYID